MNPDVAFAVWCGERQQRIEHVLDRSLPVAAEGPAPLVAAMRYAVLDGGKRVRPLLAYAAGETVGADPAVVDQVAGVTAGPGQRGCVEQQQFVRPRAGDEQRFVAVERQTVRVADRLALGV